MYAEPVQPQPAATSVSRAGRTGRYAYCTCQAWINKFVLAAGTRSGCARS